VIRSIVFPLALGAIVLDVFVFESGRDDGPAAVAQQRAVAIVEFDDGAFVGFGHLSLILPTQTEFRHFCSPSHSGEPIAAVTSNAPAQHWVDHIYLVDIGTIAAHVLPEQERTEIITMLLNELFRTYDCVQSEPTEDGSQPTLN
jgi:hypothetical protein